MTIWLQRSIEEKFALKFCRISNKGFSILNVTRINHDKIHNIRNNCLSPIFFSPGDSHTQKLIVLLYPGLEGVADVETDPKWRFVSFKVAPFNERVLCVYVPSRHKTPEQAAKGN